MAIYYLTKHCLSDGIVEADTETTELAGTFRSDPRTQLSEAGTYVRHYRHPDSWTYDILDVGKEAFADRADAVADAEKRRAKKLASLRKSIAKLEALEF